MAEVPSPGSQLRPVVARKNFTYKSASRDESRGVLASTRSLNSESNPGRVVVYGISAGEVQAVVESWSVDIDQGDQGTVFACCRG